MVESNRVSLKECIDLAKQLPPEVEEGNVEYKLKLDPTNVERLEHLCTQLQWRITEFGECWYELGVSDDGSLTGTSNQVLGASIACLKMMCQRVQAQIDQIQKFPVGGKKSGRFVAEVHIRPKDARTSNKEEEIEEIRVAFSGESNAGKSTLIGVLAYGHLDNGKGDVRLSLLRHRHEILTGRTSSVAVEPLILSKSRDDLSPLRLDTFESSDHLTLSARRSMLEAPKIMQFFDLPGKPRHHRSALTTFTSLAGPDLACLVVSSTDAGGFKFIQEQVTLTEALDIPSIIVLTKVDLVEDCTALVRELAKYGKRLFQVSTTTGEGIEELMRYLIGYVKFTSNTGSLPDSPIFVVESVKNFDGIGLILKGATLKARMDEKGKKDGWLIGPSAADGTFTKVQINSIHRLRLPVHGVDEGLMAAIAVSPTESTRSIETARGVFLVKDASTEYLTRSMKSAFTWHHPNVISGTVLTSKEAQGTLYIGCVRLTVRTKFSEDAVNIEAADKSLVFLVDGMKLVLVTPSCILAGRWKFA